MIQDKEIYINKFSLLDRKYLERTQEAEREGREVRIIASEIPWGYDLCARPIFTLSSTHNPEDLKINNKGTKGRISANWKSDFQFARFLS